MEPQAPGSPSVPTCKCKDLIYVYLRTVSFRSALKRVSITTVLFWLLLSKSPIAMVHFKASDTIACLLEVLYNLPSPFLVYNASVTIDADWLDDTLLNMVEAGNWTRIPSVGPREYFPIIKVKAIKFRH